MPTWKITGPSANGLLPFNHSLCIKQARRKQMSIHLIITLKAKKSRLAAFTEIMMQAKTDFPEIEGCQSIRIFKDTRNPCTFSLIETWDSEEHHKSHLEEFTRSGGWEHMSSHLTSDPVVGYFSEI